MKLKIIQEVEPYQQKVKSKHKKRKFRLIGKGLNKHREKGMSNPSYERSKSAPPIGENLLINEMFDLSSFKIKESLYPKFWDDKVLKEKVKNKLKKIAKDFVDTWEIDPKIYDITLTGSLANYTWNNLSDVDLHILINFDEIDDRFDMVKDYLNAKKNEWNHTHDIKMNQHEVEVYVQHLSEEHSSSGVYSILDDKWLVIPDSTKPTIDEKQVNKKVLTFVEQINKVYELYKKEDYKVAKEKADKIFKRLKSFRQIGLEDVGEFSVENLAFKVLRKNGFLDRLSEYRDRSYDKMMGIEGPAKRDI